MDSDTLKFIANFMAKKLAAYLAASLVTIGALHPGADQAQFTTMLTGVLIGVAAFIWSWWNDRGKQAVLADLAKAHGVVSGSASTATASKALVNAVNDNKVLPVANGAVKIASAIVIAALVAAALTMPFPVRAQTTSISSTAATQIQQVISQIQSTINNFINFAGQLETTDLNLAISLAQSQNNATAVTCWQTIEKVQIVPIPTGAGLAWFKQYYLGLAAQYVNINQSCSTVAPAYVKLYDQAIQQMQSLNL